MPLQIYHQAALREGPITIDFAVPSEPTFELLLKIGNMTENQLCDHHAGNQIELKNQRTALVSVMGEATTKALISMMKVWCSIWDYD